MQGIILDLETTGLNPKTDEIIEIGLVLFEFNIKENKAFISNVYSMLQESSQPLSQEIMQLTGINDSLLKGKQIDWALVNALFAQSDLIVAHNMGFDRSFVLNDKRIDNGSFDNTLWGCSQRHINWKQKGIGKSVALNYLAADAGFVNPSAHRAVFDCATTFRLVQPHISELYQRCQEKEYLIAANFAPFEKKDQLKNRSYRWDAQNRVWTRVIPETQLAEEREFLKAEIYLGEAKHSEQLLDRV